MKSSDLRKAQLLLYGHHALALGTASVQVPGYPYVSFASYVMGSDGCPLILVSELAEHTHNLKHDARCSLLVTAEGAAGPEQARLSLIAEAISLAEEEVVRESQRFYRYFPQMQDFHTRLDFRFFRLLPLQGRFIAGFGRACWIDWESPKLGMSVAEESALIRRMNERPSLSVVGIDPLGMDWRHGESLHRHVFEVAVTCVEELERRAVAAWSGIFTDLP